MLDATTKPRTTLMPNSATMLDTATKHDLALPPPEQMARGDFDIVVRRLADDLGPLPA